MKLEGIIAVLVLYICIRENTAAIFKSPAWLKQHRRSDTLAKDAGPAPMKTHIEYILIGEFSVGTPGRELGSR